MSVTSSELICQYSLGIGIQADFKVGPCINYLVHIYNNNL